MSEDIKELSELEQLEQFNEKLKRDFFPSIDHGLEAVGNTVLIQAPYVPEKTKSGILLAEEVRQTEMYNTQIGKVIQFGPLAFKDKTSLADWKEGQWCDVGDIVFIPRTGYRINVVPVTGEFKNEKFNFFILDDVSILLKIRQLHMLRDFI